MSKAKPKSRDIDSEPTEPEHSRHIDHDYGLSDVVYRYDGMTLYVDEDKGSFGLHFARCNFTFDELKVIVGDGHDQFHVLMKWDGQCIGRIKEPLWTEWPRAIKVQLRARGVVERYNH